MRVNDAIVPITIEMNQWGYSVGRLYRHLANMNPKLSLGLLSGLFCVVLACPLAKAVAPDHRISQYRTPPGAYVTESSQGHPVRLPRL